MCRNKGSNAADRRLKACKSGTEGRSNNKRDQSQQEAASTSSSAMASFTPTDPKICPNSTAKVSRKASMSASPALASQSATNALWDTWQVDVHLHGQRPLHLLGTQRQSPRRKRFLSGTQRQWFTAAGAPAHGSRSLCDWMRFRNMPVVRRPGGACNPLLRRTHLGSTFTRSPSIGLASGPAATQAGTTTTGQRARRG